MIRTLFLLAGLALLTACGPAENTITGAPVPLGDFKLGHNVVVASKMQKGPISRDATEQEWVDALTRAVNARFGRYEGDQLYHFGISVEGYMLAPPGIPVLYNPRSALIINITVWDDAAGGKLNSKVHQITALEDTTSASFWKGSGRERTKQEQIDGLAFNAVEEIEEWLVEQQNEHGWFNDRDAPATNAAAAPSG